MSQPVVLNGLNAGISRLRNKGGADPKSLYDLENGYVTIDGTLQSRDGTTQDAELPAGTKGLCAFDGGLVVFAIEAKTTPAGYTAEIIVHPNTPGTEIAEIHYAGPFLGYLYVAAEFADGETFHYWLQARDAWAASTAYKEGDIVEPTVRNGFAYRAHRVTPPGIQWAPDVARTVGDVIEPTTPNGYQYEVVDTLGASPRSGATEPTWPTTDGAQVYEDADSPTSSPPTTTTPPDPATGGESLPPDTIDRYGNRYWGTP